MKKESWRRWLWRWWHFERKTPGVQKISTVQIIKFPQKLRGTYTFKMKVVAFYVSILHVYWKTFGEDIE